MAFGPRRATGIGSAAIAPIDPKEVYAGMAALVDPLHRTQLQAMGGSFPILHCDGNDYDEMAETCERWNADGPRSIFWKINPVVAGCQGAANDKDIEKRSRLLIDVDTCRPGHEDDPATDAEKEASRAVARQVKAFLTSQGWSDPIVVDSGNGWHLLYRIDLPNDDISKAAIKRFLKALAAMFDCPAAKIDPAVYNASRYARVPGTLSRRGTESPERPWRKCKTVQIPEEYRNNELALFHKATETLETTAAQRGTSTAGVSPPPGAERVQPSSSSTWTRRATNDAATAYVKAAIEDECKKVGAEPKGNRNNALNTAAFNLGQLIHLRIVFEQEMVASLTLAAFTAGLEGSEVEKTIRSGLEAGKLKPREIPKDVQRNGKTELPPEGVSILVKASEIEPRKVEWLWPGRIPLGKLTTFAGIGGLGKTFVLLDIAAKITRGSVWPDEAAPGVPGKVIFASGEDDADDTLVPRLIELGADLGRVFFFKPEILGAFTLADLVTLDRAVADAGEGVRLVCIDPPTAYLGEVNDHKNAELRGLLSPLKDWASRQRVAMVFITHVSKSQGQVSAQDRVIGSVAWINAVRAAHLFANDPDNPGRQVFLPIKMNLSKKGTGLAYRLVESGDVAKVEWLGEVDISADDAAQFKNRPRAKVATEFLIEKFREKLEWPGDELFKAAHDEGIHRSAMYEARKILNLPRCRFVTHQNGDKTFTWWVPPDWPQLNTETVKLDEENDATAF